MGRIDSESQASLLWLPTFIRLGTWPQAPGEANTSRHQASSRSRGH